MISGRGAGGVADFDRRRLETQKDVGEVAEIRRRRRGAPSIDCGGACSSPLRVADGPSRAEPNLEDQGTLAGRGMNAGASFGRSLRSVPGQ